MAYVGAYNLGVCCQYSKNLYNQVYLVFDNIDIVAQAWLKKYMNPLVSAYFERVIPFGIDDVGKKISVTYSCNSTSASLIYNSIDISNYFNLVSLEVTNSYTYKSSNVEPLGKGWYFEVEITSKMCNVGNQNLPSLDLGFDWVAWAINEKSKLDNYKKGYDIKFWTTGKKMSSSAVILGGTLGFSVSGVNYTLDDIIKGTLSPQALGKTFAEGIAKCKGIWLRIGGILGAILESSIVKTITGVFTTGGLFYVSYALFTKLMDYTQSLTGSMDDVSYPGWWTQGTTYTEDSTTGSGMAVVPSTNSGAVDNWENYSYTNTDTNGYVTGATSSGTTVTQGNTNLGTVTLANGATVALGIATGTSIPLAVPETTKIGLNILDGQAISLDTSEALVSPLPMQPVEWKNVPPPWMVNPIELHLSDNLSNWTVPNIKIDTPVILPVEVPDVNVKVDVNVPSIPNINVNVPTIPNIQVDIPTMPSIPVEGAITLTPPTSIPLTAPTEPVPMTFDTTSVEAIKAISDNIASRNELETTRAEADTVLRDLRIVNEQTTKDNTVKTTEKLYADLAVATSEASLRGSKFGSEQLLEYVPAQVQAYNNLHDGASFKTKEGMDIKKGYYANPVLANQKTYNDTQLSEGKIRGKDKFVKELLPTLKAIIPETTEGTIKRFADVNPSMREDFDEIVKSMFVSGVV